MQLAEQVTGELGFVLVDYRVAPGISGGAGQLQLYCGSVTGAPGANADDCANISRELGYRLEATGLDDYFPGGYRLEVSTPGLYRKLRSDRELTWAVGKRIKAVRSAGGRPLVGTLNAIQGDSLLVLTDAGEQEISRTEVSRIKLHPDIEVKQEKKSTSKGGRHHGK